MTPYTNVTLHTTPDAIRNAARSICATSGIVRVAVAFWGSGACENLGLTARDRGETAILLNAQSGACNPDELSRLMDQFGTAVRTDDALHSKVYLSEDSVLVGSANASANGLGLDGDRELVGWAEACIETQDSAAIDAARTWFEDRWKRAVPLSRELIDQLRLIWRRSRSLSSQRPSLSDARRVFVVMSPLGMEKEARRLLKAAQDEGQKIDGYQGWNPPRNAVLLDFEHHGKKPPRYTGAWVTSPEVETLSKSGVGKTVHIIHRADDALGLSVGVSRVWRVDPVADAEALDALLATPSKLREARKLIRDRKLSERNVKVIDRSDYCIPVEIFRDLVLTT